MKSYIQEKRSQLVQNDKTCKEELLKESAACLRFIKTLNNLISHGGASHLLRIESSDELQTLFALACENNFSEVAMIIDSEMKSRMASPFPIDYRQIDEKAFDIWFEKQKYSFGAVPNWTQIAEMKRVWCIARSTLRSP